MALQGLFAKKSAFTQLTILILLTLIGALIFSLSGTIILMLISGSPDSLLQNPDYIRSLQFLSAIGTFIFPAFGMAWLCGYDIRSYLSIGKIPGISIFFYLLLAYFISSPILNLTQYINQQMSLPSFMEPLENWMRLQEDNAEKLTLLLLADNSVKGILFNLLVIAITAGIAEELFFRGALQRVFERWNLNPHAVIWITAILFSAFHLQFYGFIPRMLMGAYFGYLLYWSRNIWLPVIAHTINNTVVVVGMSNDQLRDMTYFNGEFETKHILPLVLAALVSTALLFLLLKQLKKKLNNKPI